MICLLFNFEFYLSVAFILENEIWFLSFGGKLQVLSILRSTARVFQNKAESQSFTVLPVTGRSYVVVQKNDDKNYIIFMKLKI